MTKSDPSCRVNLKRVMAVGEWARGCGYSTVSVPTVDLIAVADLLKDKVEMIMNAEQCSEVNLLAENARLRREIQTILCATRTLRPAAFRVRYPEVTAVMVTADWLHATSNDIQESYREAIPEAAEVTVGNTCITITHAEVVMVAEVGEWIVAAGGECWVCDATSFYAMYMIA